jgi:hypothetical protein
VLRLLRLQFYIVIYTFSVIADKDKVVRTFRAIQVVRVVTGVKVTILHSI